MKKLLSILGGCSLIATTSSTVVGCDWFDQKSDGHDNQGNLHPGSGIKAAGVENLTNLTKDEIQDLIGDKYESEYQIVRCHLRDSGETTDTMWEKLPELAEQYASFLYRFKIFKTNVFLQTKYMIHEIPGVPYFHLVYEAADYKKWVQVMMNEVTVKTNADRRGLFDNEQRIKVFNQCYQELAELLNQ